MLEPGRNCWKIARADRFAVVVDAERYFAVAREAFLQAERRILLVGWDFDARIALDPARPDNEGPDRIGKFLLWLVERKPTLEIYLLRWDLGALKSVFRGTTLPTILKFARHPRIHVKLDGHHPPGSSHHQKLVAVDDCFAFCGGIDMTSGRWDTRAHRDDEPDREGPWGRQYEPWHDATTAVSGAAAQRLAELCRDRWALAGGERLAPLGGTGDCWPASLEPLARDVEVAIARTLPEMPDTAPRYEIEQLFIDQIAAARRYVYLESQYFASRRVAEAIARRLDEPDPPEFVIVNPCSAQGWLEPIAMDSARARLVTALRQRDRHDRLRLYHPRTAGGGDIYVHAKIAIVDDVQLRVGSANLNNRSMRLDTECDVLLDASTTEPSSPLRGLIAGVRDDLIAEHLGIPAGAFTQRFAATGSLIAAIEQLRGAGRSLAPYEVPDLHDVEAWLADNEVLDPESPSEMFEPVARTGLLRRLGRATRHLPHGARGQPAR